MNLNTQAVRSLLQSIEQHEECTAENIMKMQRQLITKLCDIHCPLAQTRDMNWAFILYSAMSFRMLEGIRNADGTPGAAVPAINDPGLPTAGNHAQTETWKWNKNLFEDLQLINQETTKAMMYAFTKEDPFLDRRNDAGHLYEPPFVLINYIRRTHTTQDQRDTVINRAEENLRDMYDPSRPPSVYYSILQEA